MSRYKTVSYINYLSGTALFDQSSVKIVSYINYLSGTALFDQSSVRSVIVTIIVVNLTHHVKEQNCRYQPQLVNREASNNHHNFLLIFFITFIFMSKVPHSRG